MTAARVLPHLSPPSPPYFPRWGCSKKLALLQPYEEQHMTTPRYTMTVGLPPPGYPLVGGGAAGGSTAPSLQQLQSWPLGRRRPAAAAAAASASQAGAGTAVSAHETAAVLHCGDVRITTEVRIGAVHSVSSFC